MVLAKLGLAKLGQSWSRPEEHLARVVKESVLTPNKPWEFTTRGAVIAHEHSSTSQREWARCTSQARTSFAAAALLEIDSTENMSTAAAHVKKETAMNIVQRKSHSDHTLAAQRGCRKGHLQDPTPGDEDQQHLREAQASLNFAWSQKQPRPELFLLGQPRSTERTPP